MLFSILSIFLFSRVSVVIFFILGPVGLFFFSFSSFSPFPADLLAEQNPSSQNENKAKKLSAKSLSMRALIRLVLDKSDPVRIRQLEILKSDTDLRKSNSIYAPTLEGGLQKQVTKKRYTNSFTSGDTTEVTRAYIKAKKLFSSGTYFETEAADNYVSSEEVNNPAFSNINSGGDIFSPAKLHTTNLSIVLRQELLRNAFGYNFRRNVKIQQSKAQIQRQNLIYDLSALVVNTMIDFWQLAIAQENTRTSRRLLENTRRVRAITVRKRRLGLAEAFEIKQWNALLSQAQTRLEESSLRYDNLERSLLRILNLSPKQKLNTSSKLKAVLPANINFEKDLKLAYRTRPDYKSMQLQKENAKKALEIAGNQLLPSLSVGARYTGQGFDPKASKAYGHSTAGKYPEYSFDFKIEYPLWDEGRKVEKRNAKINLRQLEIQEKQLRRQIRDEIKQGIQEIKVAHNRVLHSKDALASNRAYYNGLLRRYRQGRFSATAVKNALDTLVQSEQGLTESMVNFNIALVRYALRCNTLFKQYNIDIDKVVDRMRTQPDLSEKRKMEGGPISKITKVTELSEAEISKLKSEMDRV